MKKIFFCLSLFSSSFVLSQDVEFNHSAGFTYLVGMYSYSYVDANIDYSETSVLGYPGVTYNPRLDFKLDRELSLSLTTYPTLCFNKTATYNSRSGGSSSSSFAFEIPTGVQLNFGNHSSTKSRADFGGFIMAGYNFGAYSGIGKMSSITTMAGMKFYIREQAMGIRLEYNIPLGLNKADNEKLQLFGVGLLYNFER